VATSLEFSKMSEGRQGRHEARIGRIARIVLRNRCNSRKVLALAVLILTAVTITATATPAADPLDTGRHFLPSERLCSSNFDCESPLTCREYPTGSGIRRCYRYWELSDPAEVTKIKCSDDSCGLSYVCEQTTTSSDSNRCAHLPEFVWSFTTLDTKEDVHIGSGIRIPYWFVSGGRLEPDFPRTWDIRKRILPPAPKGYMWESGRIKADPCGHCGRECPNIGRLGEKYDPDPLFTYYLEPAS